MNWASIIWVVLLVGEPAAAPARDQGPEAAAGPAATQPATNAEPVEAATDPQVAAPAAGDEAEPTASPPADAQAPTPAEEAPRARPLSPLEIEDAAVVARHMFLPRMTAVIRTTAVEPASVDPGHEVFLTGLMCDGDEWMALFEDRRDRRSLFLAIGDSVGPWRIEHIEMEQLTVVGSDGASVTLRLGESLKAMLPAPPASPPPTAAPAVDSRSSGPPARGFATATTRPAAGNTRAIEQWMRDRRERERGRF